MIGELINKKTNARASWQIPPADLKLQSGSVDMWLTRLDTEETAEAEQILSADERTRSARFRFAPDKKRFVAARRFLRIVLGKYLQTAPHEIRFDYNEYGKPSVGGKIGFNLSHSDNLALLAVTEGQEIGVDIERINPSFVDEQTAKQFLTRREIEYFQTLSGDEQVSFFFDCWTRKEAYLKERGNGLSLPPNQIEVAPIFLENSSQARQFTRFFPTLPAISGYAAALSVELDNPLMRFYNNAEARTK
jgi:4'-phosphopantetheinyl transferase